MCQGWLAIKDLSRNKSKAVRRLLPRWGKNGRGWLSVQQAGAARLRFGSEERAGMKGRCFAWVHPGYFSELGRRLYPGTVSSSKHLLFESSPPFHRAQHFSPLMEPWVVATGHLNLRNCVWLAREWPCPYPLPSGENVGGWLPWGSSWWPTFRALSGPESTIWKKKWYALNKWAELRDRY